MASAFRKPLTGRSGPIHPDKRSRSKGRASSTHERLGRTTAEITSDLLALRQRMFDGLPIEEIRRLGRVAKNLLQQLKEAGAEIPRAVSTSSPRTKAARP
jgi:phosphate uptake regulator